jgi:hypothetical protein
MCGEALSHKGLFFRYFKNPMLSLVEDRVISVRMALARVLKQHYVKHLSESLISDRDIALVIEKLKQDKSSDIR